MVKKRGSSAGRESSEVTIQNPARLPAATVAAVRKWLNALIIDLCPGASFAVRLDTDRAVAIANEHWRGISGPTDVLSFPGGETEDGNHLGDVLIAVPTARRQAAIAGHTLERELKILLLHGALHCLGYDHETDDGTMSRLEAELRRRWVEETSDRVVEQRS